MDLRRKYPGLKLHTEAMDTVMYGRRAFCKRRNSIVRSCGDYRRENAGISSASKVRTLTAESLRFPGEGQSAQGKPGPKTRLKSVVDGQLVENPVPPEIV